MMNGHANNGSMEHGSSDRGRRGNNVVRSPPSRSRSRSPLRTGLGGGGTVPNPYGYSKNSNEDRPRRKERGIVEKPNRELPQRNLPQRNTPNGGRGMVGIVRQGSARMIQTGPNQRNLSSSSHNKPRMQNNAVQHVPRDKIKPKGTAMQQPAVPYSRTHEEEEKEQAEDEESSKASEVEESIGFMSDSTGSEGSIPLMNVMDEAGDARQNNTDAKKDALVESLVWFSHHTPRAVLEDLVSHEIEIWHAERGVEMTIVEEGDEEEESEDGLGDSSSGKKRNNRSSSNQLSFSGQTGASDRSQSVMNESAVSELSLEEGGHEFYDGNFSESILKLQQGQSNTDVMIKLPKMVEREGALLFVDITGFTKLSTMLDCESLSKVINSYFDMIVNVVVLHGGDILKFAGDAFFAEWKVNDYGDTGSTGTSNPLSNLNASLSTMQDMSGFDNEDDIPRLSTCVLAACKCAAVIVEKFSDFLVSSAIPTAMPVENGVRQEAILNVHCGVGAGHFVGLHVGDYKEDPDEEGVELRREFLVLGDPIEQAALAADAATDGEVLASPKALASLAFCCDDIPNHMRIATEPLCIATKGTTSFSLDGDKRRNHDIGHTLDTEMTRYEALRTHCRDLNQSALARLHLQMALYVHPVIRDDELAVSAQIRQGKIAQPQSTIEDRHLAEAELRSVFTIFIKAVMAPKITGDAEVDGELYSQLGDIMHVVSRELDRYSGHLRQFIVDDKGMHNSLCLV